MCIEHNSSEQDFVRPQDVDTWFIHCQPSTHWILWQIERHTKLHLKIKQRLSFSSGKKQWSLILCDIFLLWTLVRRSPVDSGLNQCWRPFSDLPFHSWQRAPLYPKLLCDSLAPKSPIRIVVFGCSAQAISWIGSFSTIACVRALYNFTFYTLDFPSQKYGNICSNAGEKMLSIDWMVKSYHANWCCNVVHVVVLKCNGRQFSVLKFINLVMSLSFRNFSFAWCKRTLRWLQNAFNLIRLEF